MNVLSPGEYNGRYQQIERLVSTGDVYNPPMLRDEVIELLNALNNYDELFDQLRKREADAIAQANPELAVPESLDAALDCPLRRDY